MQKLSGPSTFVLLDGGGSNHGCHDGKCSHHEVHNRVADEIRQYSAQKRSDGDAQVERRHVRCRGDATAPGLDTRNGHGLERAHGGANAQARKGTRTREHDHVARHADQHERARGAQRGENRGDAVPESVDEHPDGWTARQRHDGVHDEVRRNATDTLRVSMQRDERGDAAEADVHEQDQDARQHGATLEQGLRALMLFLSMKCRRMSIACRARRCARRLSI